jgi:hypothetical protein
MKGKMLGLAVGSFTLFTLICAWLPKRMRKVRRRKVKFSAEMKIMERD